VTQILFGQVLGMPPLITAIAFSFCSFLVMSFISNILCEIYSVDNKQNLSIIFYILCAFTSFACLNFVDSENWVIFPLILGAAFPVLRLIFLIKHFKTNSFIKTGFFICSFLTALHILDYAYAFNQPDLVVPGYLVALVLSTGISCFSFAAFIERAIYEVEVKDLLHNTSRLAAIGGMASEIAHEINNPLSVLALNNIMLRQKIESGTLDDNFLLKKIDISDRMTERLLKIVSGLKSSYRSAYQDDFKLVRINDIFEEAKILCEMKANKLDIDLIINRVHDDVKIECRSVQIVQIIQNIVYNAFDALEKAPNKWVMISYEKKTTDFIQIIIKDSGPGISKQDRKKIFASFYTTKPNGKGTGLGLSISKRFSEEHNGSLSIDALSPETTFILELPLTQPLHPKPVKYHKAS
jgi:signal transduction histidine kinase